ncbi:type II toxin-antitoxin system PemK/MazF family toxin [Paenibacillus sp. NRS-1781]|uniref:type II toxin-antitoxin system PemK/MazF family toxin n=1 Tax=Paenibacillus sp. NRS-1781 TaxID=3233905 RepID=UPI003D283E68
MSATVRYANRRALFDDRKFNFGDIWLIDDEFVNTPPSDQIGKRKKHVDRWVAIVSNNDENFHPLCPIVTVAPLSHRVDLMQKNDLELFSDKDSVAQNCLAQLKIMQPILKKDLRDFKGPISDTKKIELQVMIEDFFGLSTEE